MLKNISSDQQRILIVLTLINFLNYLDRQIIYPLFHLLKDDFNLSDFQLGFLGTFFMLTFSLTTVPLGILSDRFTRKIIIAGVVWFWSCMSFMSGLARNFGQLVSIRGLVGVGEAGYGPASTAMLSDNFPQNTWSRIQGIYNVGMFIGAMTGLVAGGLVAYYFNSWRVAFFIVSFPGFLLSIMAWRLRDKRPTTTTGFEKFLASTGGLAANWAYWWIVVSGSFMTFAAGAYITWGIEYTVRFRNYNLRDAGIIMGTILTVAGVTGIILGSYTSDYLQKIFPHGRSLVIGLSLVLASPLLYYGLGENLARPLFILLVFLGTTLGNFFHGPTTAVIHDVVPENIRGTAYALYTLITTFLGATFAPIVIGGISDKFGLDTALRWTSITVFLGGLSFMIVARLIYQNPQIVQNSRARI
ncbi:MAG: MFS transporter [Candidatus Yanofskybacteria bacterium]|nr:MFS transporter [Candidatus Yanofskybacteria bacterium]